MQQGWQRAAPLSIALATLALVASPALDPEVQLFFRDTSRLYWPVKRHIAERLASGELPLWYPWSEAGTSLLGQVTPALLHPFTLLYAALPFDLAFKLNHLAALPLAAVGMYLLARRLGASPWASAAAAVAYGGCGYLVSMACSNLPFALGAATSPLALWAFLGWLEAPRAGRLLAAAALLALCAFAGDAQAMLLTCVMGAAWAAARGAAVARGRGLVRGLGLSAAWAAAALMLAAPVALPAWEQLGRSSRAAGIPAAERDHFTLAPARLLGLLVPRGFDDAADLPALGPEGRTQYTEMFAGAGGGVAFSASVAVGAPALLFALFAAGRRRGAFLLAGAFVFLAASTGPALGVHEVLVRAVPGFRLFRFPEKLVWPASLLLCAAAALGAEAALADVRRSRALAAIAAVCGLAAGAAGLVIARSEAMVRWFAQRGATHDLALAKGFAGALGEGLVLAGGLLLAAALAGLLAATRGPRGALPLAAVACCASVLVSATGAFAIAPAELYRGPFALAEEMVRRAGPSEGRWRVLSSSNAPLTARRVGEARVAKAAANVQSLLPQYDAIARLEGVTPYFSAKDPVYADAYARHPAEFASALGVRFAVIHQLELPASEARRLGFERFGSHWVRTFEPRPRFLLAGGAEAGEVSAKVPRPERIELAVEARRDATLLTSTHFDPGWRATIDGAAASIERVEQVTLGVRVPAGRHTVLLEFWPRGLTAGLALCSAAVVALLAWAAAQRRSPA